MPIYKFPYDVVYWSQVEDHDEIKSELLPTIQKLDKRNIDNGNPFYGSRFRSNYDYPETFIIDDTLLHKIVWKHVYGLIDNLDFDLVEPSKLSINYWYNIYDGGNFQEQHNHMDIKTMTEDEIEFNMISGIYILDDKSEHQNILFGSCDKAFPPFGIPCKFTQFAMKSFDDVKEGTVILFPSTLNHSVLHENSKFSRTTIAFNVVAKYKCD